jgi:hypothetical protein
LCGRRREVKVRTWQSLVHWCRNHAWHAHLQSTGIRDRIWMYGQMVGWTDGHTGNINTILTPWSFACGQEPACTSLEATFWQGGRWLCWRATIVAWNWSNNSWSWEGIVYCLLLEGDASWGLGLLCLRWWKTFAVRGGEHNLAMSGFGGNTDCAVSSIISTTYTDLHITIYESSWPIKPVTFDTRLYTTSLQYSICWHYLPNYQDMRQTKLGLTPILFDCIITVQYSTVEHSRLA